MPCSYEMQEQLEDEDLVFGGPCAVPTRLSLASYEAVGHQMLDEEGHQSSYRVNLIDFTDCTSTVEGLVAANIGVHNLISGEDLTDNSFTQQMHLAYMEQPDVVIATYRSALPVLNAVRGYYDAHGGSIPLPEHVNVSRRHRESNFNYDKVFEAESNRLKKVVEGARVLVIDQIFNSGRSLLEANRILSVAGATAITGMVGYWYGDLYDEPVGLTTYPEVAKVAKLHADFMYQLGLRAATIPRQEKPQISTSDIAAKYKLFSVTQQYERLANKG